MTPHRDFAERRSTPVHTLNRGGFLAAVAFIDGCWCWTVWEDGGSCLAGVRSWSMDAATACDEAAAAVDRRIAERSAARAFRVPGETA